ncbi:hypothetical protein [Streptomyces noursei]|uniref:hypothetical protein n=1 Tax=Streptomyces noursei TaxID=1971 RepID=UPI0038013187
MPKNDIGSLLAAIRTDDREAAADRRVLKVQRLVAALNPGGRAKAAKLLNVHLSAIDQALARARNLKTGRVADWHMDVMGVPVVAGEFELDEEASDEEMLELAIAVSGYRRRSDACRHDWEAEGTVVVRRRGRETSLGNWVQYDAVHAEVCLVGD